MEFGDRTRAGAVAKYSCNPGHALNGSSTRQCLTSGVWSGAEPSCTGKGQHVHYKFVCELVIERFIGFCLASLLTCLLIFVLFVCCLLVPICL